ncbi:MAG: ribonuclease J [Oscillospiraceae bacterium]|jgi:ribonuclease J|nr:ribonuclease J [Oscillospiraceae bacterium]MCI9587048.1 ribonuclease J [Oscillospiraceae bacterium]
MKIIPLGGLDEIGKNMTVYEYGGELIVVDCGMGFPGDDMYGVDLVIPDVTYLVKQRSRIRGMFITHGHEDHIGSIPYVLKQVNMPIYCTRLTAGLIKLKLEEHGLLKQTKLITVEAGEMIRVGKFYVEFIHVNHSIADSVAFAIHTDMGVIVHTGDFKIDSTPIDGDVIDLGRFGELGREGVLALLADSTNVERPGYTMSERTVGKTFDRLFTGCKQRIIVTTFASNIHRIQQVIDAAAANKRKVAVTGRSMENIMRVSTELGYMKVPKGVVVDLNKIKNVPKEQQVIITTGSQGEEMSALYRMAFSTHKQIDLGPGDKVIISASAIPGNEKTVGRVINELFRKGVEVVYDRADALHVSGHACQEELKIIHALVRPRFFIPVHGEQRHLRRHIALALEMGMDRRNIVLPEIGNVIELTARTVKVNGSVPCGEVMVDGSGVGDVGAVVLRDRKILAEDGMVVVILNISSHNNQLIGEPEIITRGFIYVKENEAMLKELSHVAMTAAGSVGVKRIRDLGEVRSAVKSAVSNYLYKNTRRSPMIIPVINRV